jgi:hypothetical protein
MKTEYKVFINNSPTATPFGEKSWYFTDEDLAAKFLALKKKELGISDSTPVRRGSCGIVSIEVMESEKDFYKKELR